MSSCRTSHINQSINQSISRSISRSINQSNCRMVNASSMILSQEACWNDMTYKKHMQTNLDIYDEIDATNYQCCLINSSRGRFSNSFFFLFAKNDFGFSVAFMKAVSSLKNVFLKCEHGAEFQPLSNILHRRFLTSNPGPILCKSVESVKDLRGHNKLRSTLG